MPWLVSFGDIDVPRLIGRYLNIARRPSGIEILDQGRKHTLLSSIPPFMTNPVEEYSLNVLATEDTQRARPTVLVCLPVHHGPYVSVWIVRL